MNDIEKQNIKHHKIKELLPEERPRERLLKQGVSSLRHSELIAILLRTGVKGANAVTIADSLLEQNGGLAGLNRMEVDDFRQFKGISNAKIAQLMAGIELGRRIALTDFDEKYVVDEYDSLGRHLCLKFSGYTVERLTVIQVAQNNRIMGYIELYQGNVNSAIVRPAEVFAMAIRRNAPKIILAHNHPSGNMNPSSADLTLTGKLVKAGKILDIEVLDHFIIGQNNWLSIRNKYEYIFSS